MGVMVTIVNLMVMVGMVVVVAIVITSSYARSPHKRQMTPPLTAPLTMGRALSTGRGAGGAGQVGRHGSGRKAHPGGKNRLCLSFVLFRLEYGNVMVGREGRGLGYESAVPRAWRGRCCGFP
jgi:hypothetical protein